MTRTLKDYAKHDAHCAWHDLDDRYFHELCTCGLDALLSSPGRTTEEESEALKAQWRQLLVDADSMLSAYGYGRVISKEEAIELSSRCRKAYEKTPAPSRMTPERVE